MWDGNKFSKGSPASNLLVEREPMWDGNKNIIVDGMKFVGLSENQCGMETERGTRRFLPHRLSENQCGMETWSRVLLLYFVFELSEHQCGMETLGRGALYAPRWLVEREPMWDGNCRRTSTVAVVSSWARTNVGWKLFIQFDRCSFLSLSKKQCEMEYLK